MNVLVYGFYFHQNTGDDFFISAFIKLFPKHNFTFTNLITKEKLKNIDIVVFGGGSMLDGKPQILDIDELKSKKICYIGVGAETEIHSIHKDLISFAKFVAIRSDHLEKIKQLNSNVIKIPDLVYALSDNIKFSEKQSKILILSNNMIVPNWSDAAWKTDAWNYFKSEFSQFLDYLVEIKYKFDFFSMSRDPKIDDNCAALEIINKMKNRSNDYIYSYYPDKNIESYSNFFSQYSLIISQRYHGIILADMVKRPSISIGHHDKLDVGTKNNSFMAYYNLSKQNFIDYFHEGLNKNISEPFANYDSFKELQNLFENI